MLLFKTRHDTSMSLPVLKYLPRSMVVIALIHGVSSHVPGVALSVLRWCLIKSQEEGAEHGAGTVPLPLSQSLLTAP